jgi:hypothetical protein
MNWKILTGDDIQLLDTETTIMASVSPLQDIDTCVLNASATVRGYVAGGGNILEPAPAVPPECVDDVIAIARAKYLAQEPTGTLLTKIRQDERDIAYKHLLDISNEKVTITQADVPPTSEQFGKWGSQVKIDMITNPVTP